MYYYLPQSVRVRSYCPLSPLYHLLSLARVKSACIDSIAPTEPPVNKNRESTPNMCQIKTEKMESTLHTAAQCLFGSNMTVRSNHERSNQLEFPPLNSWGLFFIFKLCVRSACVAQSQCSLTMCPLPTYGKHRACCAVKEKK
jgi:hypothetical protein